MTTLLYHARQIGYICKKIAALQPGKLQAICDKDLVGNTINGSVVRWDSKSPLMTTGTTINTTEAVTLSRNKIYSRLKLVGLCPTTWIQPDDLQFPCLIRPKRHFAARKFFVVNNKIEAKKAMKRCKSGWYASPIIDKKLEFRVFVLNGEAFKVVRRYHDDPTQIAWNIANGGRSARLKKESWPEDVVKHAVEAGVRLGLDWYAADVIVDQTGKPYVLELNSAPGLGRDLTLKNLAKLFVKVGMED